MRVDDVELQVRWLLVDLFEEALTEGFSLKFRSDGRLHFVEACDAEGRSRAKAIAYSHGMMAGAIREARNNIRYGSVVSTADGNTAASKELTHGSGNEAPYSERSKGAPRTLELLSLIVPTRIATEDIGDAIEMIAELWERGEKTWLINLRIATAIFWVLIDSVRYVTSALLGKPLAKK